jgi:hypothetical protein
MVSDRVFEKSNYRRFTHRSPLGRYQVFSEKPGIWSTSQTLSEHFILLILSNRGYPLPVLGLTWSVLNRFSAAASS